MEKILVSSCLLGQKVRYDGGHKALTNAIWDQWHCETRLIGFCPEIVGGLPVPRAPAEIEAGKTADQVLSGDARVLDINGHDVTGAFMAGAQAALAMARKHHCKHAILTENSPSCGRNFTYSGRFDGVLIKGTGLTTALLLKNGIQVWPSDDWAGLIDLLT